MNSNTSSAAPFASLPQPLQLSCLAVLPLDDMLAFDTTSRGMRQLCADDVLWRPIYEDLTHRCCLEGTESTGAQRQRDLEKKQQEVRQQRLEQTSYKHQTLQHLLIFFDEENRRADQIIQNAMVEEMEEYLDFGDLEDCRAAFDDFEPTLDNWSELEWGAAERVERLRLRIKAITKALK